MSLFTHFGDPIWTKWTFKNHKIIDILKPEVTSLKQKIISAFYHLVSEIFIQIEWCVFGKKKNNREKETLQKLYGLPLKTENLNNENIDWFL